MERANHNQKNAPSEGELTGTVDATAAADKPGQSDGQRQIEQHHDVIGERDRYARRNGTVENPLSRAHRDREVLLKRLP